MSRRIWRTVINQTEHIEHTKIPPQKAVDFGMLSDVAAIHIDGQSQGRFIMT